MQQIEVMEWTECGMGGVQSLSFYNALTSPYLLIFPFFPFCFTICLGAHAPAPPVVALMKLSGIIAVDVVLAFATK